MSITRKILWQDLTVDNAESIRDFYCAVVGWTFENVGMGTYNDFNIMDPETKTVVAGICHKQGSNSQIPSQWLNYVNVDNLETSIQTCKSMGGKIIDGPRAMGKSKFAVIEDPAGAILALIEE